MKMISSVSKNKKRNKHIFRIFCRTLTGNFTDNLSIGECRWDFIFSFEKELNSEQDEPLKKLQKPEPI